MIPAVPLESAEVQSNLSNGLISSASMTPPRSASPVSRFNEPTEFSLEEAILFLRTGRFQLKLLFCTGMFMITTSLQFSILSFLGFIVQCQLPGWNVTDQSAALLSTLVFFGMLVGTLVWGMLSDVYGRKPIMVLVAVLSAFFSIIRAFSHSYESLLAIQFFLGASLSGFGVAFTYFVEFFPSNSRATWGMLLTVFWTFGMILGTLISWGVEQAGFRALCVVASIPSVINIVAMLALPKSPQFLVSKNRLTEARDVFANAGNMNKRPFPVGFVIVNRSSRKVTSRAPILASLGPRYRRTTFLLYFIWFALGFIYYGAMMMSSNIQDARSLVSALGKNSTSNDTGTVQVGDDSFCPPDGSHVFSTSDYVGSLIIAVAELPGIAVGYIFVDRAGRKATQTTACIIFAIAMFLLGVIPSSSSAGDLVLLFIGRGLSNTGYSVTWIYTPEVFPSSFRTTAFAMSECFSHIGSMITPFVGQTMLANGQLPEACMIYCAVALLCAFATFSLKVETAGKEFAADEDEFPRQFSSVGRLDIEMTSPAATANAATVSGSESGPRVDGNNNSPRGQTSSTMQTIMLYNEKLFHVDS